MAEKADFVIYNFPMPDGFLKNITEGEVAKLSVPANEYEYSDEELGKLRAISFSPASMGQDLVEFKYRVIANVKSVVKTEEWIHIEFKVEKLPDPSNDGFFKFETFKKFRDDDSEPPTATA